MGRIALLIEVGARSARFGVLPKGPVSIPRSCHDRLVRPISSAYGPRPRHRRPPSHASRNNPPKVRDGQQDALRLPSFVHRLSQIGHIGRVLEPSTAVIVNRARLLQLEADSPTFGLEAVRCKTNAAGDMAD
jgi:hypothetical protein